MRAAQQARGSSRKARALARETERRRSRRFFAAGVAALLALFVIAFLMTWSQSAGEPAPAQTRSVSVQGTDLPPLAEADKAVGLEIPEVSGESFSGMDTAIERNGVPKLILFLAHWCPHCQAEVPMIQSWLETKGAPPGIEIISVATSTDPSLPNYPPSEWLERENWSVPVIVDDPASSVGAAYGVNSYPFFVFVDADGKVHHRIAGELPVEQVEATIAELVR